MQKKTLLILFLLIALVFSSWTVTSAMTSSAQLRQEQQTTDCKGGADVLTGDLANIPNVKSRVRQICDFDIRMNELNSRISDTDRQFIQSSIASDTLEIQSLQFALDRVQSEDWRGLIQMMIAMHTQDLNTALKIAKKLNVNTNVDLTNVRIYPETPDYDLGMRQVDLAAKFLNPLMSAGGTISPTVTMVSTEMTGSPTPISTLETPTEPPTVDLTGSPTTISTMETSTPTETATAEMTGTPIVTSTMETQTETATAESNGTATETSTAEVTTPTETSTVEMTETPSTIPTTITETLTFVPTVPGPAANFDMVSLNIIEEEHVMSVETALVAQRLVQNDEIRAFAKHVADTAGLHLTLMSDLQHRLFDFFTPPTPDYSRDYQGPRRFGPNGD